MKKKTRGKKKKVVRRQMKTITLTMDRALKEALGSIADDASTDIPTVAQVLIATGMHMGHAGTNAALKEAAGTIQMLNATVHRCRVVMEANDPSNAREIFGAPLDDGKTFVTGEAPAAEGAATVP